MAIGYLKDHLNHYKKYYHQDHKWLNLDYQDNKRPNKR